jgi:non-lysosomal glucosylceramidase
VKWWACCWPVARNGDRTTRLYNKDQGADHGGVHWIHLQRRQNQPDLVSPGGLVIATWPEGVTKPTIPLPYSQETQNGYEYAAAIQMIQAGLIEEGMTAIESIRERYDGQKRNPWNEFECGSNYARSMASYSLLNAFSGFRFDLARDRIGFDPLQTREGRFTCFWSLDPGWGQFVLRPGQASVRLLYGELRLRVLELPAFAERAVQRVTLEGEDLPFTQAGGEIHFAEPVRVQRDQTLCVVT